MYPLFFIAKSNLKKKKGDVAVLFFLITLAALLLYTSMSVLNGTKHVIETAYENAHTADYFYMSNVRQEALIEEILTSQEEVAEFETNRCLYLENAKYRKDKTEEANNFYLCVNAMEDERTIGKLIGVDTQNQDYDAVLLPYYLKAAEGYREGDPVYFTIGDREYEFTVAGFVEDPLFATPLNISVYSIYITRAYMEDIQKNDPSLESRLYQQYKARLQEGESSASFDRKVSAILTKEIPELAYTNNLGLDGESMKGGDGMMSNISMGIILVFSLFLILVALIIVRFSIRNFMEMNLKNIGILEASGYTVKQLRSATVMEMGMIAFFGIAAGILLGCLGSSVVGSFEGIMMGIRWNQKFHLPIALLTILIMIAATAGTAGMVSGAYRKITVLDALRGGIHTHNFRKNYFPLEKSRLPYPILTACKNIMGEKKKNFSIFCIIILLSITSCIGFALYQNFAMDTEYILKLAGIEVGDVVVSGDNLEAVAEELNGWKEIEKVLPYDSCSVKLSNATHETTVNCGIWEDPSDIENEIMVLGRLPKYENEIVITTVIADELEVSVGDVIYVEARGDRMDYIVCGIDQKITELGRKAMMTMEGAKRLNGQAQAFILYVYLTEDASCEAVSDQIEAQFSDVTVTDNSKYTEEVLAGISIGMRLICAVFVLTTILVVSMVEILLIRTRVVSEQKNYGISKALGFTTGQLISQTMMMNMPVITIGAILGAVLGIFLMNPMVVIALSFCGIEQCSMKINPGWLLLVVIGISVVAAVVSFLASIRIRKINPVQMLIEE